MIFVIIQQRENRKLFVAIGENSGNHPHVSLDAAVCLPELSG
jgi:hypothetical protein